MKLISVPQGPAMSDKARLITAIVVGISLLSLFVWQAGMPSTFQLYKGVHPSITSPELWLPPEGGESWKPCVNTKGGPKPAPAHQNNGVMSLYLDGGLGQQSWELCQGVVLSKILNMSLMLPSLTFDPYWKDKTGFNDIYNVTHFVDALKDDIDLVDGTAAGLDDEWKDFWCMYRAKPEEYKQKVLSIAKPEGVVVMFVSMLSALDDNALSPEESKLACKAKFQALRFTDPILKLGDTLIRRMRQRANGPFLALHLRFEEDMLAHSGCRYWGGQEEQERWEEMRRDRNWPNITKTEKELRDGGKCPPTPLEVAMWLKGLGFSKETRIYLAAGKLYDEEKAMKPFYRRFPYVYRKDVLATWGERWSMNGRSNVRVAVDMHVLTHADVTAFTFDSMFAESVQGFRKWNGHKKTIKAPTWAFSRFHNKTWPEFQKQIREWTYREAGDGGPMRRQDRSWSEDLFANPLPDCMCNQPTADVNYGD